ncbi:MAG TPA: hypothetical protein VD999_05060 [Vitreimonas sp.]|nr:hypothetical protein [Vitreimonas sp.]
MKNELLRHRLAYLILVTGLGGLTLLYLSVWPNLAYQRLVILALCLFYFAWGVSTHLKTDRYTNRVAYEYLGMSALGGMVLFLVTL